jgi:ATP-dependent protease HslVU (ClpYQ) ATPase subunit
MKKLIFGLLLLVGGVLFLINHLAGISSEATDKVSHNVLSQLIATDNKPVQNSQTNAKPAETKQTVAEQVANTIQQVTDTATAAAKPPIATIKIYNKKTAKEITIETQTMLEAQRHNKKNRKRKTKNLELTFINLKNACHLAITKPVLSAAMNT